MAAVVVVFKPARKTEPAPLLSAFTRCVKAVVLWHLQPTLRQRDTARVNPPTAGWPEPKVRTVDAKLQLGALAVPVEFDIEHIRSDNGPAQPS